MIFLPIELATIIICLNMQVTNATAKLTHDAVLGFPKNGCRNKNLLEINRKMHLNDN